MMQGIINRSRHIGRGLLLPLLAVFVAGACSQELTAEGVLEKSAEAYKNLDTYAAEGVISSSMKMGEMEMATVTDFSIRLGKPDRYKIVWEQKMEMMGGVPGEKGAVWSDGTQPYVYMNAINAYAPLNSDEMALATATGISGGAAATIPTLFFDFYSQPMDPNARLIDPQFLEEEEVDGGLCYVISGASTISKEETLWISQDDFLIRKYKRSLAPPEGGFAMPDMTDEDLAATVEAMGQEVNEESKESIRNMTESVKSMFSGMNIEGSTTEAHRSITFPDSGDAGFVFEPSEGVEKKDNLFESLPGGLGALGNLGGNPED